jgi:hypothetical protein
MSVGQNHVAVSLAGEWAGEDHRLKEYTRRVATESQNGSDPHGSDEFERFEKLTKELLQVPKSELDEKRRNEPKRKRRPTAKPKS